MKESPVENFYLNNIEVEARSQGDISFASGWRFIKVIIKTKENNILKVQNSSDMEL
jgi:hypothetical protein